MTDIAGSLEAKLPPHAPTLSQQILDRVAATPDADAFAGPTADGSWRVLSWRETGEEMTKLAAGLLALGIEPEDRVAIASSTRLEWVLADGAVMLAGGANTTIYPTTGEEDVAYIMSDSDSRFLVAEDQGQADKALAQLDAMPSLDRILLIDGEGDGDKVLSWAQLRSLGEELLARDPNAVQASVDRIRPDSLATLIYTSGTTGRPKGVMLPQSTWVFQGASMEALDIARPDDVFFLWLPLSHSFGKMLLSAGYQVGFVTYVDGRVPKIVENLLTLNGFAVVSGVCKMGRVPKERIGVRNDQKIRIGGFKPMCNPIAQALLLNQSSTEFNILMGLCVGHDSLFLKYAKAPCTVLAVKDRLLGHNPLAAIYTYDSYCERFKQDRLKKVDIVE